MNPIYNTGIGLYGMAAKIASWRSVKVRKMIRGQNRTLATLRRRLGNGRDAYGSTPHHSASSSRDAP